MSGFFMSHLMTRTRIGIFIWIAVFFFSGTEGPVMANTREIKLPPPATRGEISLEEAIARRRSARTFSDQTLTIEQIGQLLWAAQGITGSAGGISLRSAPSAGALYPMEIYALTQDGAYHYLPQKHTLEVLEERDLRNDLSRACLSQDPVREAALTIVICAVYERVTGKYRERGKRYVDVEAGHIAQNVLLQAVAMGLGSVPIGAFDDDRVRDLLNLPEEQIPICIIPVGYKK
ncbi:MAG: SagB/ThcOx family dehydrogenase [Candidatus Omnitrophota bacterium]